MSWLRTTSLVAMIAAVVLMILPTDVLAQRGRGGRSFGGSRRSYSAPRSTPRGGGSFGGSRRSPSGQSTRPYGTRGTTRSSTSTQRNTFGGSRLNSPRDYTSRYGVPRKTESRAIAGANGSTNYTIHRYGGMGDGFMMGYLMGSIPWYYSMPFHPAYYYSRPYTALNPDGTTAVYPGTFQWGTLFFMLLLIGGAAYIFYVWLRRKRQRRQLGGVDMTRSSFG